jgi:hypothetical protein
MGGDGGAIAARITVVVVIPLLLSGCKNKPTPVLAKEEEGRRRGELPITLLLLLWIKCSELFLSDHIIFHSVHFTRQRERGERRKNGERDIRVQSCHGKAEPIAD